MRSLVLVATLCASLARAEIILPAGAQEYALYAYEHPALRSLVFASPESRQMAILPPVPIFLSPPPLLLRAPGLMPAYPPVSSLPGINSPARPGNRDNINYILQRAHAFSQKLYRDENAYSYYLGTPDYSSGWSAFGPVYPPAAVPGFNQPARPSNRDNTTYNLERAHRFSTGGYKQP
ncbi:MAG: hypothetical protein AB1642_01270 [Pseudomonadota bacterium]